MALKIFEKFAPRANPADADYPYGSIKNESVPGAKDGTPLDASWGNDMLGFTDALLDEAGIVPSGTPDTTVSSQRLEAVKKVSSLQAAIQLIEQWGYTYKGTFAKGFTYSQMGDAGVDSDFNVWIYVGAGAPNKVVTAGTVPSAPDYEQVTFNTASNVANANGGSVQDFINNANESVIVRNIIYVSDTTNNPTANPPVYDSIAGAMASITDNSYVNQYELQILSGLHDAREILLKDYVDIIRSPLAGSAVVIEHNFLPSESFKVRDIFKTASAPYDATDTLPIRCKISGLTIRGENLNYAIHADFNDSPELDIEINDCNLQNGDANTTASTADYALGVGVYGGQRIVCNRTLFYGRYDVTLPVEKQQGAGWIVHNRASQIRPCSVEFNDCKSLKGFYGGRIVDYGSTQEDVISINGGVLLGQLGDLLCFSNGVQGTIQPSITVVGSVPLTRVALEQQIDSGGTVYTCDFPIVVTGFSEMYLASGDIVAGDIVSTNAYGATANKMLSSIRYKYLTGGVALHSVTSGGRVAIQKAGIAAVNFEPASISSNVQVSNSSTVDGQVQVAVAGDGIFGTTIVSTSFSTGVTPNKAWVSLGFSGLKP